MLVSVFIFSICANLCDNLLSFQTYSYLNNNPDKSGLCKSVSSVRICVLIFFLDEFVLKVLFKAQKK